MYLETGNIYQFSSIYHKTHFKFWIKNCDIEKVVSYDAIFLVLGPPDLKDKTQDILYRNEKLKVTRFVFKQDYCNLTTLSPIELYGHSIINKFFKKIE